MDWTSVGNGRFQRPADSLEKYYDVVAKLHPHLSREHFTVSFALKLENKFPNFEAALRQAWIQMRFEHPKIAATFANGQISYDSGTPEKVESWASETFITKDGITANELFLDFTVPPAHAILYYLPKTSEIVVLTGHWRMDGIGSLMFLNDFLTRLTDPSSGAAIEWGKEISNLPPGLDKVLNLPANLSEAADTEQNQFLMNYATHLPSISVASSINPAVAGQYTAREELILSESLSASIVAACKQLGVGPTAAAHAALVEATIALQAPGNPANKYASMVAMNLRQHIPEPLKSSPAAAVASYHTGLPLTLVPSGSFETDAQAIQKYYKTILTPSTVDGIRVYHDKLRHTLSQPVPEGAPAPADAALDSVGVIDNYVKPIYGSGDRQVKTSDYWLAVTICTNQLWVHFWSFQGRMVFSALYNKGVYDQAGVQKALQATKANLCRGLKVKEE